MAIRTPAQAFEAMAKNFHGMPIAELNVREIHVVSLLMEQGYIIKSHLVYYAKHMVETI